MQNQGKKVASLRLGGRERLAKLQNLLHPPTQREARNAVCANAPIPCGTAWENTDCSPFGPIS